MQTPALANVPAKMQNATKVITALARYSGTCVVEVRFVIEKFPSTPVEFFMMKCVQAPFCYEGNAARFFVLVQNPSSALIGNSEWQRIPLGLLGAREIRVKTTEANVRNPSMLMLSSNPSS